MRHSGREGQVLVLASEPSLASHLAERIEAAGETTLVLEPRQWSRLEQPGEHPEEQVVDLVVTDLMSPDPDGRRLLRKLIDGGVLFGVPQLHLTHDRAQSQQLSEQMDDPSHSCTTTDIDDEAFRIRVNLATEVGRLRRQVALSSIRDELTGSHSRRFLLVRLPQEFSRARRHATPLSLVLLDIDQLKTINDRHGTDCGDLAIQRVARVIGSQVRHEDVFARWGDGSFAAILPGTSHRGAAVFANKLRGETEALSLQAGGTSVPLRLSAGIATYRPGSEMKQAGDLLRATEAAVFEAKRRGGNRVFIDDTALRGDPRWILVADRDPQLLDLADDLLSDDDARVLRAESLETLADTLRHRMPDLVVLDLGLGGLDRAAELVERVRHACEPSTVPIVGLCPAGAAGSPALDRLGVDRYFSKPFSPRVLAAVARDLMDRRRV